MFFCDLYFLVANNPNLVPNICYISCVCSSCCLLHLFLLFLLHFFHSSCPGKERWPLWVQNQWEAWQDRGWEENDGGVFTFFSVLLHSVCKSVPNMTAFLIGLWDFSIQLLLLDSKNYSFLLPFMTRMLSASLCCWPHFLLVSFKSVHKIALLVKCPEIPYSSVPSISNVFQKIYSYLKFQFLCLIFTVSRVTFNVFYIVYFLQLH